MSARLVRFVAWITRVHLDTNCWCIPKQYRHR